MLNNEASILTVRLIKTYFFMFADTNLLLKDQKK